MECRSCGTQIADKAIVCYRCGTATADPVRRPVPVRPRRRPLWPWIAIVLLVLAAVYLGRMSETTADPEMWQLVAGLCGGAAAVVLLLSVLRRR